MPLFQIYSYMRVQTKVERDVLFVRHLAQYDTLKLDINEPFWERDVRLMYVRVRVTGSDPGDSTERRTRQYPNIDHLDFLDIDSVGYTQPHE
jgi:hypothetical protein